MFGNQGGGGGGGFGNFDMSKANPVAIMVVVMILISGALTLAGDTYSFKKQPDTISEKLITFPVFIFYSLTKDRTTADAMTAAVYIAIFCGIGFAGWKYIKIKVLEPMQMKDLAKETDRKEVLINQYRNK
jgi:hypothetical protein